MSADEIREHGPREAAGPGAGAAPGTPDGAPMDRTRCLHVLSLLADGRRVTPELAAAALQFAAGDAECTAARDDYRLIHEALAAAPRRRASPGFAERVLAAHDDERRAVLPFARRLAMAASLALAITAVWAVASPDPVMAGADTESNVHAVDHFRATPYAGDDVLAGIESLLRDPDPFDRDVLARRGPAGAGAPDQGPAGAGHGHAGEVPADAPAAGTEAGEASPTDAPDGARR